MKNKMVIFLTFILAISNAIASDFQSDKKDLKIAAYPGPYYEIFESGIKPILEKQGYQIKSISFPGNLEANTALNDGAVDFSVSQHTAYLNAYNQNSNGKLTKIVHIPSIPAGVFSNKFNSINEITQGATVIIPQDVSNAGRAYRLLEKAGWIKLKSTAHPVLVTNKDIIENIYQIKIKEIAMGNIPRSIVDVDFGILPGSVMFYAGFKAKDALLLETILPDFEIILVVNEKDKNATWVKAIEEAYASREFKQYIEKNNSDKYWVFPIETK